MSEVYRNGFWLFSKKITKLKIKHYSYYTLRVDSKRKYNVICGQCCNNVISTVLCHIYDIFKVQHTDNFLNKTNILIRSYINLSKKGSAHWTKHTVLKFLLKCSYHCLISHVFRIFFKFDSLEHHNN